MKWLIDENVSALVAHILIDRGDDVLSVRAAGLTGAPDEILLDLAERESRVVLTRDKDLLSLRLAARSGFYAVLLLRPQNPYPEDAAALLKNVLARNIDFEAGMIVVANGDRIRISKFPMRDDPDE